MIARGIGDPDGVGHIGPRLQHLVNGGGLLNRDGRREIGDLDHLGRAAVVACRLEAGRAGAAVADRAAVLVLEQGHYVVDVLLGTLIVGQIAILDMQGEFAAVGGAGQYLLRRRACSGFRTGAAEQIDAVCRSDAFGGAPEIHALVVGTISAHVDLILQAGDIQRGGTRVGKAQVVGEHATRLGQAGRLDRLGDGGWLRPDEHVDGEAVTVALGLGGGHGAGRHCALAATQALLDVPGRAIGEQGLVGIRGAGLTEHGDGLVEERVLVGTVGLGDVAASIQEVRGFQFRLQIHIGDLAILPGVARLGQYQAAVSCPSLYHLRALGRSRQVEGGVITLAGVGLDGHVCIEGEHLAVGALLVRINRHYFGDLDVLGRAVEAAARE
ncbi:hypothetical protein D3C71_403170 [compost metagenome]